MVIKNESVICIDVDQTLVLWDRRRAIDMEELRPDWLVHVVDPYDGKLVSLEKHEPHIKLLKNHKVRGSTIIVWSQNGYRWAEAVVKALGLEEFVDLILTKPRAYVDDLPVQEWLTERIYISPDSNWGVSSEDK